MMMLRLPTSFLAAIAGIVVAAAARKEADGNTSHTLMGKF